MAKGDKGKVAAEAPAGEAPPRVPEWASWDDAVNKASALLKAKKWQDAAHLLARAIDVKSVKPGVPLVLRTTTDDEKATDPWQFGYILPLRESPVTKVGGYFSAVFSAGQTVIVRVLAFKAEADGGNDFVPVDVWEPVAPID